MLSIVVLTITSELPTNLVLGILVCRNPLVGLNLAQFSLDLCDSTSEISSAKVHITVHTEEIFYVHVQHGRYSSDITN